MAGHSELPVFSPSCCTSSAQHHLWACTRWQTWQAYRVPNKHPRKGPSQDDEGRTTIGSHVTIPPCKHDKHAESLDLIWSGPSPWDDPMPPVHRWGATNRGCWTFWVFSSQPDAASWWISPPLLFHSNLPNAPHSSRCFRFPSGVWSQKISAATNSLLPFAPKLSEVLHHFLPTDFGWKDFGFSPQHPWVSCLNCPQHLHLRHFSTTTAPPLWHRQIYIHMPGATESDLHSLCCWRRPSWGVSWCSLDHHGHKLQKAEDWNPSRRNGRNLRRNLIVVRVVQVARGVLWIQMEPFHLEHVPTAPVAHWLAACSLKTFWKLIWAWPWQICTWSVQQVHTWKESANMQWITVKIKAMLKAKRVKMTQTPRRPFQGQPLLWSKQCHKHKPMKSLFHCNVKQRTTRETT